MQQLFLNENKITSIESGIFDGLTNLQFLLLQFNCIDTTDTAFQTYINSLVVPTITYSDQLACMLSPTDGVCGSANGITVTTAPTTDLCTVGTPSSVLGSGSWSWTCSGANGGDTASCSAQSSVYAAGELNSSNIASLCPINNTFCDLSNKGITSIASGTFV